MVVLSKWLNHLLLQQVAAVVERILAQSKDSAKLLLPPQLDRRHLPPLLDNHQAITTFLKHLDTTLPTLMPLECPLLRHTSYRIETSWFSSLAHQSRATRACFLFQGLHLAWRKKAKRNRDVSNVPEWKLPGERACFINQPKLVLSGSEVYL